MSQFWSFLWGGLVIGGIATVYPLLTGRVLGVSSIYAAGFERRGRSLEPSDELEQALLAATRAEFGQEASTGESARLADFMARLWAEADGFRPLFLVGLVLGAVVAGVWSSDFRWTSSLGERFDSRYGAFGPLPLLVLSIAGVCIGLGARIGAGCTSGHGISGFARGEKGSLLTTAVFWCTAVAVAWTLAAFGVR